MYKEKVLSLPGFNYLGKRVIIDTGSPFSMGRIPKIEISNTTFDLKSFMPNYGRHIPEDVVAALGNDFLNNYDIKIDLQTNNVEILQSDNEELKYNLDVGFVTSIPRVAPYPYVTLTIENHFNKKLLFDTGAHIYYLKESLIENKEVIGRVKDFSPDVEEFETNIYMFDVEYQNKKEKVQFGSLPKEYEKKFILLGQSGIIGVNAFPGNTLLYSARRKKIYYE